MCIIFNPPIHSIFSPTPLPEIDLCSVKGNMSIARSDMELGKIQIALGTILLTSPSPPFCGLKTAFVA